MKTRTLDSRLVSIAPLHDHHHSSRRTIFRTSFFVSNCISKRASAKAMSSGRVSGRQLVSRPPIVPSSFDKLQRDRFDQFLLYYEDDNDNFRFKLTILDRPILATTKITYATAVFLVPAGREGEYMFSSKRGLESISESAACARLIAGAFIVSWNMQA
jgi:hypothetical protein